MTHDASVKTLDRPKHGIKKVFSDGFGLLTGVSPIGVFMTVKSIIFGLLLTASAALLMQSGCQVADGDENHPINKLLGKLIPENADASWNKLVTRLRSPDADKRREGVLMLQKKPYRNNPTTPELLQVVAQGDPDDTVRTLALEVLSLVDEQQTKLPEALTDRAVDPSAMVRDQVITLILKHSYPYGAAIAMDRLSNDTDTAVRSKAAMALKSYKESPVVATLITALRDEEFSVCYQARQSLVAITNVNFGDDPKAWRDWYEREKNSLPSPNLK